MEFSRTFAMKSKKLAGEVFVYKRIALSPKARLLEKITQITQPKFDDYSPSYSFPINY